MARFVIDLWMDGYDTEEEMIEACKVFIEEQLDFLPVVYVQLQFFPTQKKNSAATWWNGIHDGL